MIFLFPEEISGSSDRRQSIDDFVKVMINLEWVKTMEIIHQFNQTSMKFPQENDFPHWNLFWFCVCVRGTEKSLWISIRRRILMRRMMIVWWKNSKKKNEKDEEEANE